MFKSLLKFSLAPMAVLVVLWASQGVTGTPEKTMTSGDNASLATATFAGGCFWCMEPPFEKLDGVKSVVSGYTGGHVAQPSYKQVSRGGTGHVEAVEIKYDQAKVSYADLLKIFWQQIDPTDNGGSFVDRGPHYRSAIFYHNEDQKQLAMRTKSQLEKSGMYKDPIVTEINPAQTFYRAENYHQDYYKKNPLRYKYYRYRSGRDQYLEKVWGEKPSTVERYHMKVSNEPLTTTGDAKRYTKPDDEQLRKQLSPLQYKVTQEDATERAFDNTYWDNKEEGIYVDVVSGEPLFSSTDKFDSGTGWPSFTKPIDDNYIETHQDRKLFMVRTEVRSRWGDSHLGHVFDDGPAPTGKRYCINSAALRFIPKDQLEKQGYGDYLALFK